MALTTEIEIIRKNQVELLELKNSINAEECKREATGKETDQVGKRVNVFEE